MGKSWFRYHAEALNDPKVQTLPAEMFKIWINCLCIACENDGKLGNVTDVTFALRVTEETVTSALHTLVERALLVTEDVTLHNVTRTIYKVRSWNKRQYKSDSSKDRVRKYRERKKLHGNEKCNGQSNVTVTPPDTDTDTDISVTDKSVTSSAREKKPPPKKSYPPEFDEFWKTYPPNGQSKRKSFEAYNRALKEGATHEEIIHGAGGYARYIQRSGKGRELTAHATTWLNQQRWTVDYPPDAGPPHDQPRQSGWDAEAERLRAKWEKEDHVAGSPAEGVRPPEAIRQDSGGIGNDGGRVLLGAGGVPDGGNH